jgi:hypothetical protein
VAVLGRSYLVMQDAFLFILQRIPSPFWKFILTMIQLFLMLTSSVSGKRKFPVLSSPAADLITRKITFLLSRGMVSLFGAF